jgi:predicted adenine nucleotide alpha hydrolase (AANH) superfamily ATPase
MKKKVLLHACCAPCGGHIIKELQKDGFDVSVFYFNPNIYPEKEYIVRRDEMKKYCEGIEIEFIEAEYDHKDWLEKIRGFEKEPEGGRRCEICYRMRMKKTAEYAKEKFFSAQGGPAWGWETSLSISPHKNYEKIKNIGDELEKEFEVKFIGRDWKKKDGFKCSCELSRANNFYRQNYCGCEFSINN